MFFFDGLTRRYVGKLQKFVEQKMIIRVVLKKLYAEKIDFRATSHAVFQKEQIKMRIVALGSIAVPSILRKAPRLCGIFLCRSPYRHKHCR